MNQLSTMTSLKKEAHKIQTEVQIHQSELRESCLLDSVRDSYLILKIQFLLKTEV